MILDTMKNHNRIMKLINDHWNKENLKNVVDIRFVCERDKTVNDTVIRGVRINNIYISCEQLENITGKKIVHGKEGCGCLDCLKLEKIYKSFEGFDYGEVHSICGIKTKACKCKDGGVNHGK